MKVEQFIDKIKECKKSDIQTGYSQRIGDLKLIVNSERNIFKIYKEPSIKICSKCGTDLTKIENQQIIITFKNYQEPLSVFQVYMLYMVFKLNLLPYDYAQYHKCIAGKRFIENIKTIEIK